MKKPRVSLTITHPALCEEWSERNFPFGPESEHEGSHDRVWWRGKCGHEWMAEVRNRTYGRTGCPYCTGTKVLPGFNDLATLYPELVAEWDHEKNGSFSPEQFTAGSFCKVWWKCRKGHSWSTVISNRTHGHGCPVCRREKTVSGVNDLATLYPELLLRWSDRNDPLKPDMVGMSYRKQVWWKCPDCGNEYQGQIHTQLKKQTCPFCVRYKNQRDTNDLQKKDLEIAARLVPVRNEKYEQDIPEKQIVGKSKVYSNYKKKKGNQDSLKLVPVWEKYAFNIYEAAKYYGLSVGKLREIIVRNRLAEYLTWKSGHVYIIRKAFDRFLDNCHEI